MDLSNHAFISLEESCGHPVTLRVGFMDGRPGDDWLIKPEGEAREVIRGDVLAYLDSVATPRAEVCRALMSELGGATVYCDDPAKMRRKLDKLLKGAPGPKVRSAQDLLIELSNAAESQISIKEAEEIVLVGYRLREVALEHLLVADIARVILAYGRLPR